MNTVIVLPSFAKISKLLVLPARDWTPRGVGRDGLGCLSPFLLLANFSLPGLRVAVAEGKIGNN